MAFGRLERPQGSEPMSDINMTPLIDVMLVLLVIFMVVAPLTPPNTINLPKAGRSTQPPVDYIEVELKADGAASVGIHGQEFRAVKGREQLAQRLADISKAHPDLPLMISADKDIKYDEVVQTITLANKTGISRVGLATR